MSIRKNNKTKRLIMAAVISAVMSLTTLTSMAAGQNSVMNIICAPTDVIDAGDGALLVTDSHYKVIWRVQNGQASVFAGAMTTEDIYGEPMGGYYDAANAGSYFKRPWAIAPFMGGYAVTDPDNNAIRYVGPDSTKTASGNTLKDIPGGWARPTGLAADYVGGLFIADTGNGRICRMDTEGKVTVLVSGLVEPTGLCYKDGMLYICESGKNRILKYVDGAMTIIAGDGSFGLRNGSADAGSFTTPMGIEAGANGDLYIADTGNNAIRKIHNGMITVLLAADEHNMDQYPAEPMGMLYRDGQLYVCDPYANRIYTIPCGD